MISQDWWSHLLPAMRWFVLALAAFLSWAARERSRRRAAYRDGRRWAEEHPAAPLYQAITIAQGRWPLRSEGQDPCLYAFLRGFHEVRHEARKGHWSDAHLRRLRP